MSDTNEFVHALKAGWTKAQLTEAGFYDPTRLSPPKRAVRTRTKPTRPATVQDQPGDEPSMATVHSPNAETEHQ